MYSNLVILLQVEDWVCAPSFAKKFLKPIEEKIIDATYLAGKTENERQNLNLNLFEEYLK